MPDDSEVGVGDADTSVRERSPWRSHVLGQTLEGRFEIRRLLARGGMGEVYVAHDHQFGVEVAVKVLPRLEHDPGREELEHRFMAEARVLGRLRDPRILRPISYGRTDTGELYLVSELLEGTPLDEALRLHAPLDPYRVISILLDTCRGLAEAHANGVIHRDLKPGNLFLQVGKSGEETTRILDFGIAKISSEMITSDGTHETRPGSVMGTVPYMSPEQASGEPISDRSDVYSLGVVAFQCLSGRLPFEGEPAAVLLAHLRQAPPALAERHPGLEVDPRLEKLVMQMLAKRPEDRPSGAREVRRRLEQIIGVGTGDISPSSDLSPVPAPDTDRAPRPVSADATRPDPAPDPHLAGRRAAGHRQAGPWTLTAAALLAAVAGAAAVRSFTTDGPVPFETPLRVETPAGELAPASAAKRVRAGSAGPDLAVKPSGPPEPAPAPSGRAEPAGAPVATPPGSPAPRPEGEAGARPVRKRPSNSAKPTLRIQLRADGLADTPANARVLAQMKRRAERCYADTGSTSPVSVVVAASGTLRAAASEAGAEVQGCLNQRLADLTLERSSPLGRVRITVTR